MSGSLAAEDFDNFPLIEFSADALLRVLHTNETSFVCRDKRGFLYCLMWPVMV
jgi:hypothetical protein